MPTRRVSPKIRQCAAAISAWRFGVGAQQQLSKTSFWGVAAEYMQGGNLDVDERGTVPVALGGRGNVSGSYDNIGTFFLAGSFNWSF